MSYPPSPAQQSFINDLLAKRDVPEEIASAIKSAMTSPSATSRSASGFIDTLKSYPYKPAKVSFEASPFAKMIEAFEGVEDAKYAIPTEYIWTSYPNLHLTGDLLFVEVKTYKGKRYINRLAGAPGDFTRTRFDFETATGLLKFIRGRHVEFSRLFSEHFNVCGRCAAPLTDQKSRETGIGPECRKVWGL